MVGFKKVPTKAVLSIFLLSIVLVLLLYVDFSTDESLPEEIIETTENLEKKPTDVLSYKIHTVKMEKTYPLFLRILMYPSIRHIEFLD
jgi:hypothetical protein